MIIDSLIEGLTGEQFRFFQSAVAEGVIACGYPKNCADLEADLREYARRYGGENHLAAALGLVQSLTYTEALLAVAFCEGFSEAEQAGGSEGLVDYWEELRTNWCAFALNDASVAVGGANIIQFSHHRRSPGVSH